MLRRKEKPLRKKEGRSKSQFADHRKTLAHARVFFYRTCSTIGFYSASIYISALTNQTTMKYIFVVLLFIGLNAKAQTESEIKEISNSVCQCMEGKSNLKGKKETEMALGLCMLEIIQKKNLPIDISDSKQMESFGQKIGIQMVGICPSIFTALIDKQPEPPAPVAYEVSGTVKSVELTDMANLVVRDEVGKEHRMLWLSYFSGSDDFVGDPLSLKGKKVTITYLMMDVYMPKQKAYITSKQISKLVVN
jgi:hypothetical protein